MIGINNNILKYKGFKIFNKIKTSEKKFKEGGEDILPIHKRNHQKGKIGIKNSLPFKISLLRLKNRS